MAGYAAEKRATSGAITVTAASGMHGQADRSSGSVAIGIHGVDGVVDALEHRVQMTEQLLSGLGERDAARRAVEKPDAEALLEAADRLAERRSRQAELLGGAREAGMLGNGDECGELGELCAADALAPFAARPGGATEARTR